MPEPTRWGRGVAAAAALALLVSSPAAPLAPTAASQSDQGDGDQEEAWQVRTLVNATVVDNYATVEVTAEITQGGPDPEFPFEVRVPDDAYVTGLRITRENRTYEGEIRPAEVARADYERHKAQGGTAGLVEARDHTTYRYLVNVEEATSVTATLTYETYLEASNGTYTLPLEAPVSGFGRDRGAAFDVAVRNDAEVQDAWGAPAAEVREENGTWHIHRSVGPLTGTDATPFNASYTLAETDAAGGLTTFEENGTGYFAHRFRATPEAQTHPVDMTLVLDTSGSMSGLKIDQLRGAATRIATGLDGGDRLRLVPFDSAAEPPWSGFRRADEETRDEARRIVSGFTARGSTNVEEAIAEGFAGYDSDRRENGSSALGVLVFLTDGRATEGERRTDHLREQARKANDGDVRVFGLAFGGNADWELVHGLAADGEGASTRVSSGAGAELDLRRFMGRLTAPALRNVTVDYDGAVEAFHPSAPVLFAGSELLVVGSYDPALEALSGNVTAEGPDGPVEESFSHATGEDEDADFLPDLVAYHRLRAVEKEIDAVGERPELVQHARNLSVEHGFVTDYTSLVVTAPHENGTRSLCEGCTSQARGHAEQAQTQGPAGAGGGGSGSGQPAAQAGGGSSSGSGSGSGGGSSSGTADAGGGGSPDPDDEPGELAQKTPQDPSDPDPAPADPGSGGADAPGSAGGEAAEEANRDRPEAVPGPGLALALAAAVAAGIARRRGD